MASPDNIVLGIDLGTTFSAMSLVNNYGKAEIVTNAEGYPTTPSVVHFYDGDAVVVGEEAVKMVVVDPENVVRFIKRHMGEEDFTLDFFGQAYNPQEISALILRKLKEDAEELYNTEIHDAVVTVPAYFNSSQRGATAEAGAIAGLHVLSIINEPTAAAIAYGLDRIGGRRNLLVMDLGGGTFDVTVMRIRGTKLTTIASDGNAELGGKDWDDRLLNHVAEQFFEKYQLDPRDEPSPYQELYERVLAAKISLSTKERALIPVNFHGRRMAVRVTRDLFQDLTLDLLNQCEETTNIVLGKASLKWPDVDDILLVGGATRMPMVQNLLKRLAGIEPEKNVNPEECVALGAALAGVFRHRPHHPALMQKRQSMKEKAAKLQPPKEKKAEPPPTKAKSSGAAAIGLAYGGHVAQKAMSSAPTPLTTSELLPDVVIEDVTTHPLGIVVFNKKREETVVELIPEATKLPYEFHGRFAYAFENMTAVRVEVTEGAGKTREQVAVIGKVELTGLPPRPRGTPIEVIYNYGIDQILTVQVVDVETGAKKDLALRFQGGMTADQVSTARGRNRQMIVD
ncbi:MAG: Hsp70 family protein [Proteobacteria bacterium]|nr:Hsp70 family protein [Pseudomonadota bacterium]